MKEKEEMHRINAILPKQLVEDFHRYKKYTDVENITELIKMAFEAHNEFGKRKEEKVKEIFDEKFKFKL
jgi:hypothetical protein